MFCKTCGNTVPDEELFCEHCGELLDPNFQTEENSDPTEDIDHGKEKKRSGAGRKICLSACLAVFALIAAVVIAYFCIPVKLTDCITVETNGINGYGTVNYSFDEESICDAVLSPFFEDVNNLLGNPYDYEAICDNLINCISVEGIQNNGKYSNGESVSLEISFNKNDKPFVKPMKGGTLEYKVSDLKDGDVIDPFSNEYVDIIFEGENGDGKVTLNKKYADRWVNRVTYTASKSDNLSNGDIITVTAEINTSFDYYFAEKLAEGKLLQKKATKKITVSGLNVYAAADDVSRSLIKEAKDLVTEKYSTPDEPKIKRDELNVLGVYFKELIGTSESDARNSLDVIISFVDTENDKKLTKTVHVVFENIKKGITDLDDVKSKEAGFVEGLLNKDEAQKSFLDNLSDKYKITDLEQVGD